MNDETIKNLNEKVNAITNEATNIIAELNRNLHYKVKEGKMTRDEAYAIFDDKRKKFQDKHDYNTDYLFLYPEMPIYSHEMFDDEMYCLISNGGVLCVSFDLETVKKRLADDVNHLFENSDMEILERSITQDGMIGLVSYHSGIGYYTVNYSIMKAPICERQMKEE